MSIYAVCFVVLPESAHATLPANMCLLGWNIQLGPSVPQEPA